MVVLDLACISNNEILKDSLFIEMYSILMRMQPFKGDTYVVSRQQVRSLGFAKECVHISKNSV